MDSKLLLVGWDAADWKIIQTLMDANLMPHTRRLVEGGVMSNLSTLAPVLSPMLWTSIATGKRAHKHGIHGFVEPAPNLKGVQPVTNLSRKCKAIWNILCQNEKRCNVVGWWPSSPVEPINGVMVSNHYQRAPKGSQSIETWKLPPNTVHPPELLEALSELRVHPTEITADHLMPFVPHGAEIDQSKDRRLENVVKNIADCSSIQACATHLIEHEPWDFMAVYFDAIDHFCHGFMRYHPPKLDWVSDEDYRLYKNVVSAGYVFHDMMLGRLIELAGHDTTIMLISDHGFHPDHLRLQQVPLEPAGPAAEHREHGIFVLNGSGIKKDHLIHGAGLLDIAPTILHLFGLPIGDDMDGRVVTDAFESVLEIERIPSWDIVPGDSGQHPAGYMLEAAASEQAIDQLVELGYIERPSDNLEQAIDEANIELDYNLARAYMDAGMHGDAVSLLIDLYQKRPLEFRFGIQLALCLQTLEQIDDLEGLVENMKARWGTAAIAARQRLLEFRKLINERIMARKSASKESGPSENKVCADDLTEGSVDSELLTGSDLLSPAEQAAIRKVKSIAAGNPQTLDYLAGWVAMSRGKHDEALEHFRRAENTTAMVPGFYFHLAETYRNLKAYDQANENYQRVLGLDSHNAGAYLGLARLNLNQGNNKLAYKHAKEALGLKYNLAPAHFCVAVFHYRRRDFHESISAIDVATSINPNFVEAYNLKAKILREEMKDVATADAVQKLSDEILKLRQQETRKSLLPALESPAELDLEVLLPRLDENVTKLVPCLLDKPVNTLIDSRKQHPEVVVVSGLPRSGTSMMMQMLVAAGYEPFTDGKREADQNNLRGYFEHEKTRSLSRDNDWLFDASGKCVKVVSPLIPYLPQALRYRVIVMDRDMDEIVQSQARMISRLKGKQSGLSVQELTRQMDHHYRIAIRALQAHAIPFLEISHSQTINQPSLTAQKVAEFLGNSNSLESMQAVVDRRLYRESTSIGNTKG